MQVILTWLKCWSKSLCLKWFTSAFMPDCKKWHFLASRLQNFLGEHVQRPPPSPRGRVLTFPEVLQLPALMGPEAYFRTYWNPCWKLECQMFFAGWTGHKGRYQAVHCLQSIMILTAVLHLSLSYWLISWSFPCSS